MPQPANLRFYAVTLDCPDPLALAGFYARLLGWQMPYSDEDYAVIAPPGTQQGASPGITFQKNPLYTPPVWPEAPDAQQQMAHLDIAVDDLDQAVAHAMQCGATQAEAQFNPGWRVMLDPAGHPFCLCLLPQVFAATPPT